MSLRSLARLLAAVGFMLAGANHFVVPDRYARIVPPSFPRPGLLVAVSGVAEIAGGVGLLIPRLRRPAAWGLIALLLAVFPANLYMATTSDPQAKMGFPQWALWVRLPLQAVLIAWVWWASREKRGRPTV